MYNLFLLYFFNMLLFRFIYIFNKFDSLSVCALKNHSFQLYRFTLLTFCFLQNKNVYVNIYRIKNCSVHRIVIWPHNNNPEPLKLSVLSSVFSLLWRWCCLSNPYQAYITTNLWLRDFENKFSLFALFSPYTNIV